MERFIFSFQFLLNILLFLPVFFPPFFFLLFHLARLLQTWPWLSTALATLNDAASWNWGHPTIGSGFSQLDSLGSLVACIIIIMIIRVIIISPHSFTPSYLDGLCSLPRHHQHHHPHLPSSAPIYLSILPFSG